MFDHNNHTMHHQSKPYIEYWNVIRRHKWAIISITTVATIIGVLIASSIKPVYMASARLLVEPDTRQLLTSPSSKTMNNPTNMSSFYRTQLELIRSRSLAKDVIEKNNLVSHLDYLPKEPGFFQQFLNTDEKGAPLKAKKIPQKKVEEIIPSFNARLKASLGRNSDIIDIAYESGDPVMAADVVNTITKEYIERVQISQRKNSEQNIEWLAQSLEEARKKLVQSEAELQAYQVEEKVGDSDEEARIKSGKLGGITKELLDARTKRAEAEIRFKQVSNLPRTLKAYSSLQYIVNDPIVQNLKQEESDKQKIVYELSERYGDKHPKMISAKNDLKLAESRVKNEIFRAVDSVKKQYDLAVAKEKEVNRIYEQMQRESLENKGTRFSLAKLEREVETNKELYNLLLTRFKEADMTKNNGMIDIRVIDSAVPPKNPYKPNRQRIIFVSFLLGLIGSCLLSFLREFNDKTFKTGEDVVEKIKMPLLGIFPILNKKDLLKSTPERLIVEKPRSSIAESINNIRTNIILGNDDDDAPQIVMVTSAVASEGKTTVSCNLGISLARLGPTLIIEADTRRPRMRNLRHHSKIKGGVFEYVAGKASLKDSVYADSQVKNLYTMPVHTKPAKPIEFLSSKRFKEALLILRKKFKFIVIDTPPVLPVSDALVLAPIVDGTVLVIGAESTKHAMAKDAINRIETVNAPILGCVLTRANPKTFGSYGSNYYYGYGYGYSAY